MPKTCPVCDRVSTDSATMCDCGRSFQVSGRSASSRPTQQSAGIDIEPVFSMQGVNGVLDVFEDKITITPKGVLGFLSKGLKGTKTIPIQSITALQFKESGVFSGYIQFSILGGVESRGGVLAAAGDENTFMFAGQVLTNKTAQVNKLASQIKEFIESRMERLRAPHHHEAAPGIANQIEQLARMKESGLISDEEFIAAKRKLLR